ncbi:MAG: membrane protein insertase YidC [Rhodothermaceae bacterium]|nr:membrane protein insertase YidC [Rhodothermaceae bacterium]
MEQQGVDRSSLIGIILISLILGVWMLYLAPQPEPPVQEGPITADTSAVISAPDDVDDPLANADALQAPTDSLFAAALTGEARDVVVVSDRYRATFSTHGGSLRSMKLLGYNHAESTDPVELVSNEAGALALVFNPPQGRLVDTRTLFFRPSFGGDSLRVGEEGGELAFEAPVGEGVLRFVYGFIPDSYEVTFRVETEGTNVLAQSGGYEMVWDGALPLAENNPREEVTQAGAFVRWGGDTDMIRLSKPGQAETFPAAGQVDWVAVKTKFFAAVLIPEGETEGASLEGSQIGEADVPDTFAQDYTARLEMPRPEAGEADAFRLYLGPMELRRLASYDLKLYDMVEFGFGAFMTRPLARYVIAPSFAFLSTFLPNYGLVIIIFAFLLKLVLYPLTKKSYTSMAKMRDVQPEMEAIKEKHADDPQKQQEAMMRLYRERGVNPLGGCLPMLLQYPILIAMWRYFQSTLVLRGESFLWAPDLSAPDPILHLPFALPLYGDFVAGFTLLMGISMIFSMKFASPGGTSISGQQKMIMYAMPAFFFLFFNRFPSGLSLYYLAFNTFTVFQQRWINKHLHDHDDDEPKPKKGTKGAKAKPGRNGRASSNGQAKKRSKAKR